MLVSSLLYLLKKWLAKGFPKMFSSFVYIQFIKTIVFWILVQSYGIIPLLFVGCDVDIAFSFQRFIFQYRL